MVSEETEEEPTTVMKKTDTFKRQFQASYLKYGFIKTGNFHALNPCSA